MLMRLAGLLLLVLGSAALAQLTAEGQLPEGAYARFGSARMIQAQPLSAIAMSRDGKTLATTSGNYGIQLWDTASGVGTRFLKIDGPWVSAIALSPDAKHIAFLFSEGAPTLGVMEVANGNTLWTARGASSVAYLPDGTLLTIKAQIQPALLDPTNGKQLRAFGVAKDDLRYTRLALSHDGTTLTALQENFEHGTADAGRFHAIVWDVASGKERLKLKQGGKHDLKLSLSADGKRLALAGAALTIVDANTGTEIWRVKNENASSYAGSTFSLDGKFLAAFELHSTTGADNLSKTVLRLFDARTGENRGEAVVRWPYLFWLAFSPDSQWLVTTSQGEAAAFWSHSPLSLFGGRPGHQGAVQQLRFTADSKTLVSYGVQKDVRWWDVAKRQQTAMLDLPNVTALDVSADGKWLAVAETSNGLTVMDANKKASFKLDVSAKMVRLSPNKQHLAFVGLNGRINLVHAKIRNELPLLGDALTDPVLLAFSADSKLLLSVIPSQVIGPQNRLLGQGPMYAFAVVLWDVDTSEKLLQHQMPATCADLSPDGQTIAAGDAKGAVVLVDVATKKSFRTIDTGSNPVRKVVFSPDSRSLATCGTDLSVQWWDIATGQERHRFFGHTAAVESVAFAPNGKMLASGSVDTSIVVWNLFAPVANKRPVKDLWAEFLGDAGKFHSAAAGLLASPAETLEFIKLELKPIPEISAEQIKNRIIDLDSEKYTVRTEAMRDLEMWQEQTRPHLVKVLEGNPTLELRRRVEILLAKLESARLLPSAKEAKSLDILELLEHLGTAESRQYLEVLAAGGADGRLTQAAQAVLGRLDGRKR